MSSTWKKLVSMWKSHKARFLGALFCFVLVFGVGAWVNAASATDAPAAGAGETGKALSPGGDIYDMVLSIVANILDTVFGILFKIVVAFIQVLIWIVSYDSFSDNAVIKVGWPIVRNAINMFVILGLLFIAIKNLVPGQSDNAKTQSQLFKILLAVVLMNFSQTITLLAVDFSQVVTVTFAQAIADIGSGNFIQLFGLQDHLVVASTADNIQDSVGQGAALVGGGLFKLVMVGAVGIAILVMIVAFAVRMVLLWFLIIVSPAAFFAFGLEGVFPMVGQIWKQWSDQFMGLLIFGPVLTFFLWLSLAIAAGGNVASTVGFENLDSAAATESSVSFFASASMAGILSTVMSIVMIFIGVAVAAQVASSSVGVNQVLSKGSDATRGFIKWGAKKAAYGTAIGAGAGLYAGAAGAAAAATGVGFGGLGSVAAAGTGAYTTAYVRSERGVKAATQVSKGIDYAASRVQSAGGVWGGLAAVTGLKTGAGVLRQGTGAVTKALGGVGDERMRAAEERAKNMDTSSLQNELARAQQVLGAGDNMEALYSPEQIAQARVNMKRFVTDKDYAKKFRDTHGEEVADDMTKQALDVVGKEGFWDYISDEKEKKAAKENFFKFKAGNLRHLKNDDEREAVLNDPDFKKSMLTREDLFEYTVGKDGKKEWGGVRGNIQKVLQDTDETVGYDNEGNPKVKSIWDQVRDGRDGTKKLAAEIRQREASTVGGSVTPAQMEAVKNINWATISPSDLTAQLAAGTISGAQIDRNKYTGSISAAMAAAIAANIDPKAIGAMHKDIVDEIGRQVVADPGVKSNVLGKIDKVNAKNVPEQFARALGTDLGTKLESSMTLPEVQALPEHVRTEVDKVIAAKIAKSPTAPLVDERRHVFNGKMSNLNAAFQYTAAGGFAEPEGEAAFVVEVNQNPQVLANIPIADAPMRDAIVDELNTGTLKASLEGAVRKAINSDDAKEAKKLRLALKKVVSGLNDKIASVPVGSPMAIDVTRHRDQIDSWIDDLK